MSTKRNILFIVVGIILGALVTALLFSLLKSDPSPPTAEPSPPPAVSRADTEQDVAQSRKFDVPKWEILSPERDLRGSCHICGQIFSEDQNPIPGATVRLRLLDEPWETANLPNVATTDDDGKYCFHNLTANATFQLFAWASEYAAASYENVQCDAATDLYLEKGAVLTLRFVDVHGYSVPYVEVHLAGSAIWPMRRALSDERGRLSVKGLPEGLYSFSAQKDRLAFSVLEPISLEAGEEIDLEAQMTDTPPLSVTVADENTHEKISGAIVTVTPQNESLLTHTYKTDKSGMVSIPGASVAGISLSVLARGYVQKAVHRILPGASVNVLLSRGAVIRGVVQTPGGKPIAGAQINVQRQEGDSFEPLPTESDRRFMLQKAYWELSGLPRALDVDDEASCIVGPPRIPLPDLPANASVAADPEREVTWGTTSGNGEFQVDAIPPGDMSLGASHDEFVLFRRPTLHITDGQPLFENIPILMKPGATLSLRVVSSVGQPIGNANVTVYTADRQIWKNDTTQPDGYVTLTGLPEEFRLEATAENCIPGSRRMFGPPGKTLDATIRLEDANEVLRGRVVNRYGTGVGGVAIEAELMNKGQGLVQVLTTETGDDGTFTMEGAGTGEYMVRARIDDDIVASADNITSEKEANLVVEINKAEETGGVTAISPTVSRPNASPGKSFPRIPTPSSADFGSGDSLGVTVPGRSAGIVTSPGFTEYGDAPQEVEDAGSPGENPDAGYTTGSSQSAFGQADDLVVTGHPAGIGTIPIALKNKNKQIIVSNVQPGSLVDAAGLKSGDTLITIDGREMTGIAMARRALQGPIGSVVMIEVLQEGQPLSVVVQRERK